MSILTFPLSYAVFGQCFDLIRFDITEVYIYKSNYISGFTMKSNINTFTSEFLVTKSSAELANFLGMDIVSYLKRDIGVWQYGPDQDLLKTPEENAYNQITIIVKMSLRTMNETVLVTAPIIKRWEAKVAKSGGTHYLKSIIYGAEIHSVIEINAMNKSHYRQIRRAFNREIGMKGTFDEYFKEKLEKIVKKLDTWYMVFTGNTYGIEFGYYDDVDKLLQLKNNLEGNRSLVQDDTMISFEFHSLSEISSSFPSIEINRKIIMYLERLQLIFVDVKFAYKEFKEFNMPNDFIRNELRSLKKLILQLIKNVDITTERNVQQFNEIFLKYGSGDTKKYRRRILKLIKNKQI